MTTSRADWLVLTGAAQPCTACRYLEVQENASFTSVNTDSGLTTSCNILGKFITPYHYARLSSAEATFSGPRACLK